MYDICEMNFKRRSSMNFYKNLKFTLAKMTFTSNFINGNNQNMYPKLTESGNYNEYILENRYKFDGKSAKITRLLGQHFPYATYKITINKLKGHVGLQIRSNTATTELLLNDNMQLVLNSNTQTTTYDTDIEFCNGIALIITCRNNNFDIYLESDCIKYITTFNVKELEDICKYDVFSSSTAAITLSGNVTISEFSSYIDCGIAQADIRPIRYENGDIIIESGKIYLTASIRMQEGAFQGVFSWIPGTSEFALTGAVFYDAGDGIWGDDVAASIMYHRPTEEWYLWVCSFSHNHILAHAKFKGDMRFGVNVIDITLMPEIDGTDDTAYAGKHRDEDPDFIYDKSKDKWYMTICRKDPSIGKYRYYLFESSDPFCNYKFIAKTTGDEVTGGSIIKINGKFKFICGSGFKKLAEYHIYDLDNFNEYQLMKCDYNDGGFRGWGSIMPLTLGSRTRYFWITFDRYRPSEWNWSYGNIYCYEADKFNY